MEPVIHENELPERESAQVEFKEYQPGTDFCRKIWREVAAFSSMSDGGRIYVGVSDDNDLRGRVDGVPDANQFQKEMEAVAKSCIDPRRVSWVFQPVETVNGMSTVVIISVYHSPKPVSFCQKSAYGWTVYYRNGTNSEPMHPYAIAEYYVTATSVEFDKVRAAHSSINATMMSVAQSVEDQSRRATTQYIRDQGRFATIGEIDMARFILSVVASALTDGEQRDK